MKEVAEVTDKNASIGMKGAFTEENTSGSRGKPFLGEEVVVVLRKGFLYSPIKKPSCLYSAKLLLLILNKLFSKAKKGVPWWYYTTQSFFSSYFKKSPVSHLHKTIFFQLIKASYKETTSEQLTENHYSELSYKIKDTSICL